MRLQRYLAACGIASRRAAETLIETGHVHVNGATALLGDSVDPATDVVTCDGRPVCEEKPVYILLNKPRGVVTSACDTHGRKTVLDCVDGAGARVFPVGRLDMDVEGALLLTNHGELAFRLTHPRYEVEKVYLALVHGTVTPGEVQTLQQGVTLPHRHSREGGNPEDEVTAPARVTVVSSHSDMTLLCLTLHEGKKREVKRMCAAVGHPVRELQRVSIGGIQVKGLRIGEWRYLRDDEIAALHKAAGLSTIRA